MFKREVKSTLDKFIGYKQNVMDAINWVVGFIEILFFIGFIKGPALWIQISSFILMVIIAVVYFGIYIYWMLYDPSRLQSEGYNLEKASMLGNDQADEISFDSNNKGTLDVSESDRG